MEVVQIHGMMCGVAYLQAFSLLSIQPNHLGLLAKLPSNMKILLLQHAKDG